MELNLKKRMFNYLTMFLVIYLKVIGKGKRTKPTNSRQDGYARPVIKNMKKH